MISQRFTDIELDEADMEEINAKVMARTDLDGHNKATLRGMLIRQMKKDIWDNRDYVYGVDEGEPNRGDLADYNK